jgi:hypothetical protein
MDFVAERSRRVLATRGIVGGEHRLAIGLSIIAFTLSS